MICNQGGTCFARTANGKCGILSGGQYPAGKCKFQKQKVERDDREPFELQGNPYVILDIDRLEHLRIRNGLAMHELSTRCGMSRSWYQASLDRGGRTRRETAEEIAKVLGVGIEVIVIGEG